MADFTIKLRGVKPAELKKLQAILRNPQPILTQIGRLLLAEAQLAFKQQKFGDVVWPSRYPNHHPFIANVAGVVADAITGRPKPKPNRFVDRPAGIDTRQTVRSLRPETAMTMDGLSVTVKSETDGAKSMQDGAQTTQYLTKEVRTRLGEWMASARRSIKRATRERRSTNNNNYALLELGWLFSKKALVTQTAARPFLGVTPDIAKKLTRITSGEFVREANK